MKNGIEIGEHNRPEVITVNLLEDEEAINIVKKTEETDWEFIFTNHAKYDDVVKKYDDPINEIDIPAYTQAVFNNYDPTNIQLETEIVGEKKWLDGNSKERPESITVYLLANDKKVDKQIVTAKSDWKYTFTNVPEYDVEREKISYSIVEETLDGYTTSYEGYNLINLRVGTTEIKIVKNWRNNEKENRPDWIQVDLLQDKKVTQSIKLSEEIDWTYSFSNLREFDQEGRAYVYTIEEKPVKGYKTGPVRIKTKKENFLKEEEGSKLLVPIVGGILVLLGLAAGRNRKK